MSGRGWLLLGLLSAQLCRGPALGQHRPVQYGVRADYDSYFGFYPTLSASWPLDSLRDLTVSATYYANPAFFGLDLGISAGFTSVGGHWSITPGVGLVSGSLFVAGRPFTIAEGFAGALTVQHEGSAGFVQGYVSYYGAWKRLTPDTYNFLFYSAQAGRCLSERWRLGLIYEQLANARLPRNRADISAFWVPRIGLATEINLSDRLTGQVVGGWTRNEGQRLFFRVGLSSSLPGTNKKSAPHP